MEIPFDRLPDNFVDSIDYERVPVTPRPAATIVLLRDASEGMEVLLARRTRSAGFVPGAYVFPGGRVDAIDGEGVSADVLDGLTTEEAESRLELAPAAEPNAIAYYVAALREAFEETGILVARRGDGSHPPSAAEDPLVDELRVAVLEDQVPFPDALRRLDCTVDATAIEYIAHWVTPEVEPRRYDTRFFAAAVSPTAMPIIDPREMTDAVWITPGRALERLDDGSLPMVFPTIKTIEQLAHFDGTAEALSGIGSLPVRTILPTLVITETGVEMKLDDDE